MAGVAAALVLAALAGCGAGPRNTRGNDQLMTLLQAKLPGRYDNAAQVRTDAQAGTPQAHAAMTLLIAPAYADLVGKTSYYVRETDTGDPRHVLSQSIWVLGRTTDAHGKQERLEMHIYLFKEPQRWTQVGEDPELLQSLLPQDLQRLPGCELTWSHKDKDPVYIAQRNSQNCAPVTKAEGMLLEQRIELRDNQLALQQQQISADGLVDVTDPQTDAFFRFVHRGAAN
jgi:CpeT/CpcT family protein DUF1001